MIRAKDFLRAQLGSTYIYTAQAFGTARSSMYRLQSTLTWKDKALKLEQSGSGIQLHLGCGDKHIDGMLNCDYRATRAADIVMDCANLSRFAASSVSLIFCHAFFEHLYRKQHAPFLAGCSR